ncbi:MAG: hypothetical protein JO131_09535 [Gammaproteobacteria bacterium]|nr:hypothetical protein [Gammaproteobacteria bacterium]
MPDLSILSNSESFSTKDIMLILSKIILSINIPKEDQHKIPNKYIALFAEKDCAYARARQQMKNPEALLSVLIKASSLKNNIDLNPKTKIEYKLYLEQLETSIKKADEQLAKQKDLTKALDEYLSTWLEKHRVNCSNLTRTGVTMESSIMTTSIDNTFKEVNQLLEKYKAIVQSSETTRETLVNTIASTEAVVPQQMVKDAATQAARVSPSAYEEQKAPTPGDS